MSKRGFILACIALVLALGFMLFGPSIMEYMAEQGNGPDPIQGNMTTRQEGYDETYEYLKTLDHKAQTAQMSFRSISTLEYLIYDSRGVFVVPSHELVRTFGYVDSSKMKGLAEGRTDYMKFELNVPLEKLQSTADSIDSKCKVEYWDGLIKDRLREIYDLSDLRSKHTESLTSQIAYETPFSVQFFPFDDQGDGSGVSAFSQDLAGALFVYWDSTKSQYPFSKFPLVMHPIRR